MKKEKKLILELEKFVAGKYKKLGNNICYFAADLVQQDYDPITLAEIAKRRGLAQRLGYLAELCAQTTEAMHLENEREKLTRLYKNLGGSFNEWQYLSSSLPLWGKNTIKSRVENGDLRSPTREKWKIFSALTVDEVEDSVDLYVTRDWMNYSLWDRTMMREQGIKYTRRLIKRSPIRLY